MLDTNFNASFHAFALKLQSDDKILAGGPSGIARFNPTGSVDTNFLCTVTGTVWGIDVQDDGKIIIGGGFSSVNGTLRSNIASSQL